MEPFPTEPAMQGLDFWFLRERAVTLYWRPALYERDVAQLRELGYRVFEFDAGEEDLLERVERAIGVEPPCCANLDGLRDHLFDLVGADEEPDRAPGRIVFGFRRYEEMVRRFPDGAAALIEILSEISRYGLLFGRRVIVLVQTRDPDYRTDSLGIMGAGWNRDEWGDITRHPNREPRDSTETSWLRRAGPAPDWLSAE